LEQHHHDRAKRKFATAGEMLAAGAMAITEAIIMNEFSRDLKGGDRGMIQGCYVLHPDNKCTMYLLCTFKSLIQQPAIP
jgi:hypothetical protein